MDSTCCILTDSTVLQGPDEIMANEDNGISIFSQEGAITMMMMGTTGQRNSNTDKYKVLNF